ncbi:MAG: DUF1579 family protein [Planctomycetota bacterium]
MFNLRPICAAAALVSAAVAATAVAPTFFQEEPKPTEQHEMLMKGVGEWEGTLTMTMPGMEGAMKATETVTAFGSFWTHSNFTATFDEMPFPYHGHGQMGFDPATEEFVGTWTHNTDPHIAVMRGKMNDAGEMVMHWEAPMPMTGELVPHRSVTKHGDGEYEMKFFMGEGDAEFSHMTIAMKRK